MHARESEPIGEHRPDIKRQAHRCNEQSMSVKKHVMKVQTQKQRNMRKRSTRSRYLQDFAPNRQQANDNATWHERTQTPMQSPVGHKTLQWGEYWFQAAMQDCNNQQHGKQTSETNQSCETRCTSPPNGRRAKDEHHAYAIQLAESD